MTQPQMPFAGVTPREPVRVGLVYHREPLWHEMEFTSGRATPLVVETEDQARISALEARLAELERRLAETTREDRA